MSIGTKLRELRKSRGLTLRDLARKADRSPGYLSLVERGKVSPTVSALMRLSDSLGVPVTSFFTPASGRGNHLLRREHRPILASKSSGARHELLKSPDNKGVLHPMLVSFSPNSRSGDAPHFHTGEECLVLLKGRLEFTLGDQTYLLRAGDSLTFPSVIPHAWRNRFKGVARGLWVSASESEGFILR